MPSNVPSLIPTPTKPQFDTVTPTSLPSNQPTLSPIGPASITVFSTNNTLVLNITLPDETRLRRRLIEVSDDTIVVLERTIDSVASRDLTEDQRVKDVAVTNVIILENGEVEVIYDLALEELCGDDPCDAQNGIELFDIVTQSITDQVVDGNFTEELNKNADDFDCVSQDCSTLKSATVLNATYDQDPQVQKVTATPTASPSQFDPLSSKSAKRPKSAKTKASKRSGKGRKRKSKSTQSPTSSPAVIGSSSSKGSKGSSSKSQKSSKTDDKRSRKRQRDHTDQNELIIHKKDEPPPVSSERRRRRKHVSTTDTSFTLLVDDSRTRDEYSESINSKIYRPMRKRKHTIAENA